VTKKDMDIKKLINFVEKFRVEKNHQYLLGSTAMKAAMLLSLNN